MKSSVAITSLAMNNSAINSEDVIKKLTPHVSGRNYLASSGSNFNSIREQNVCNGCAILLTIHF